MYRSTSGTCSSLNVTFSILPMSLRCFLAHLKPPSPSILVTWKALALYACTAFRIDDINVFVILSHVSSAVPKSMFHGVVITRVNHISAISSTSCRMCCHLNCTCFVGHLVAFQFNDHRLGLNMSSVLMMSSFVIGQFRIILPSTHLTYSFTLGLPIMSWGSHAFTALQ